MSTGVRDPVAGGNLYVADPQQLRADIDNAINSVDSEFTSPKMLIVPQSGLATAPTVGGSGLIMLESERDFVERAILIADHVPGLSQRQFAGIAVPRAVAFRTPLGDLLLDRQTIETLHGHPRVVVNDRPFVSDTALEVHLPPLQRLLGTIRIVPMLVGEATTAEVVDVLERVWGDRSTLIVLSSSFAVGDATSADAVTAAGEAARSALLRCDHRALRESGVTSPRTLSAASTIMSRRSMGVLELASDTVPNPLERDSVVDVSALAAWEATDITLGEDDVSHLRALARAAVHLTVLGGRVEGSDVGRVPPALAARRATVVTLRRGGEVRGSAGTIEADRALAGSVVRNAAAACADPRLPSVQPSELDSLELTISLVSPIERIFPLTWDELAQMLEPGRHGVLVMSASGRAAQLPAMWSRFSVSDDFVGAVAQKANVNSPDKVTEAAWYRFETLDY